MDLSTVIEADPIEYWLVRWGRYMRVDDTRSGLGYPSTACGMGDNRARIHSWEDLEDGVEHWGVRAVDAAVQDVPQHRVILHAVYAAPQGVRVLGEDVDMMQVEALLQAAQEALRPILRRKGLAV